VTFQGFGSFTPVTKASRMVQTPKGVKMQLPERKGLRFKISSEFKSAVQGK
jgi:nucleoid DNA-binding protein